jgi:3-oxoacyl-[acyl-carrier-protein] synthase II
MRGQLMGMSRRGDAPAAASRPFDAMRDGVVNGEGAGAFILETRSHALARGVPILGTILGIASAFEPIHKGRPRQGTSIRQAILSALHNAGRTPAEIGCLVAHGLSTLDDDRLEAQAIRATLGDVPVTAPKSYFGYLGPATGSLETAVGILACRHGRIPATLNYEQPDPQCPVNVVCGKPIPLAIPAILVLSHSPQGQAVAMVLGSAE